MIYTTQLIETWTIICTGTVQGVGFRPTVARLAMRYSLTGRVKNINGDVLIEIQGLPENIASFVDALLLLSPPVQLDPFEPIKCLSREFASFEIIESVNTGEICSDITPDQAICNECIIEMQNNRDRRSGYSQIGCNKCGPRLGGILNLPFDRARTSYSGFEICESCRAEYLSPNSRRFHGQLISCGNCGPCAKLLGSSAPDDQVAAETAIRIARGDLGLIKGISGVHLVCRADTESVVNKVRFAKKRPAKPFPILVRSINHARRYALLSNAVENLLVSSSRPIVVVSTSNAKDVASSVTCGLSTLGLMLPSSGFYVQLLAVLEEKFNYSGGLVCTSANISGETMPRGIEHVEPRIKSMADFKVDHSRDIIYSCDDSVFLCTAKKIVPIRLGRGSAPMVMKSSFNQPNTVGLSYGPKANICTMDSKRVTLWPHAGSGLFNTREQFRTALGAVNRLSRFTPIVAGVDLETPDSRVGWITAEGYAVERVQHHHGHAVAVAVEHGLLPDPSILGLICDGYGLGNDGMGWGGEIIDFDFISFRRKACVRAVCHPMGVDRRPTLLAHSFLKHAQVPEVLLEALVPLADAEAQVVRKVFEGRIAGVSGGSTGRLFDAVSALLGLSHISAFEGQPAILLEQLAMGHDLRNASAPTEFPRFSIVDENGFLTLDERPFFAGLAQIVRSLPATAVAYWFHIVLADGLVDLIERTVASYTKLPEIVLSGGCMQNMILVSRLTGLLRAHGLNCHLPKRVPVNDAGLSVGFARIAGARTGIFVP